MSAVYLLPWSSTQAMSGCGFAPDATQVAKVADFPSSTWNEASSFNVTSGFTEINTDLVVGRDPNYFK